jgi:hypothetical protein
MARSDTPAVATSSVTRGAPKSGRTTNRSVARPLARAATSATSMATPYGTPAEWAPHRAKTAMVPNSPWAKLKMPLDL